jgi:cytochrome c oxidase subunit 2
MDRSERIALVAAGLVMVAFLVALVYAAAGLGIAVPTCVTDVAPFSTGSVIDKGNNHYEVHVVAKMWSFDPPEVRLPTGAEVDLYLSAKDVTHGLYLEHSAVNLMAVPGSVNAAKVRFDEPGTYAMICHEYCGAGHQNMAGRFVIGAVEPAAPTTAAAAAAGGGTAAGQALFAQKGCVACHTVDGTPGLGPTLKGVLGRHEELADGGSITVDEAFIEQQIRTPNTKVLKGFQPIMPPVPMTDAELRALVEYVKTL